MLIVFQFFFLQLSDEEEFKSASAKGWAIDADLANAMTGNSQAYEKSL